MSDQKLSTWQFAQRWGDVNGVDHKKAYHRVRQWVQFDYIETQREELHPGQKTVFIIADPETYQPPTSWNWGDNAPDGYASTADAAEILGIKRPTIHYRMKLPKEHANHLEFIQEGEGTRIWIKLPEKQINPPTV